MPTLIGQTLNGRYAILDLIGEGGMAEVYRARHIQLDRLVAVKVMLPHLTREANFAQRFEREARLVAQLHHPHIIQVYDYDAIPAEQLYYMVVELLSGPSLAERLAAAVHADAKLPLTETLRIVRDVAAALAYAHGQGMIHRDIKPGNVMLDGERVVLTDFGLARVFASSSAVQLTASSVIVGTPAYLAPEQAMGQPGDARSDLYSLGIMLYQMVTNRLPFVADTPIALLMQHVNTLLESPSHYVPDLPPGLESVILQLTAKDPDSRYPTADALIADLDSLNQVKAAVQAVPATLPLPALATPPQLSIAPPDSAAPSARQTGPRWSALPQPGRRLGVMTAGVAVLMLAALALMAFVVASGRLIPPTEPLPTLAMLAKLSTATPSVTRTNTVTNTSTAMLTMTLPATKTISPTPNAVASSTPSAHPCTAALIDALPLELRTGPGDVFPLSSQQMQFAQALAVTGVARDALNQQVWWQVQTSTGMGWVPGSEVSVSGPCASLPVVNIPTPTGTLTTPTRRPTASRVVPSPLLPTAPAPTNPPPTLTPLPTNPPPTPLPTDIPTLEPSPTETLTNVPTDIPTDLPTLEPSATETLTEVPTDTPTLEPSPTAIPTTELPTLESTPMDSG